MRRRRGTSNSNTSLSPYKANETKQLVETLQLDIAETLLDVIDQPCKNRREKLRAEYIRRNVENYARSVYDLRNNLKTIYCLRDQMLDMRVTSVMNGWAAAKGNENSDYKKWNAVMKEQTKADNIGKERKEQKDKMNEQDNQLVNDSNSDQGVLTDHNQIQSMKKNTKCKSKGAKKKVRERMKWLTNSVRNVFRNSNKNTPESGEKKDETQDGSESQTGTISDTENESYLTSKGSFESNNSSKGTVEATLVGDEKVDGQETNPPTKDGNNHNAFCFEGIDVLDPDTYQQTIVVASIDEHVRIKTIMLQRLIGQLELQNATKASPLVNELTKEFNKIGGKNEEPCTKTKGCRCPLHVDAKEEVLEALLNGFVDAFVTIANPDQDGGDDHEQVE